MHGGERRDLAPRLPERADSVFHGARLHVIGSIENPCFRMEKQTAINEG